MKATGGSPILPSAGMSRLHEPLAGFAKAFSTTHIV